jgi:hypothetical protein
MNGSYGPPPQKTKRPRLPQAHSETDPCAQASVLILPPGA